MLIRVRGSFGLVSRAGPQCAQTLLKNVALGSHILNCGVVRTAQRSLLSSSGTCTPPDAQLQIRALQEQMSELYRAGRYGDARDVAIECRNLVRKNFGPEHPASASAANNLALMHKTLGDLEDARHLYDEALKTYRVVLGDEHTSTATAACNLALLYRDGGFKEKHLEAIELLEGALDTRRKLLGENHPDVASVLQLLASVVARRPEGMTRALELLERALDLLDRAPGK